MPRYRYIIDCKWDEEVFIAHLNQLGPIYIDKIETIPDITIDLSGVNEKIKADFLLTGRRAKEFKDLKKILGLDDQELIKRIFKRGIAKEFEYASSGNLCVKNTDE